MREKTSTRKTTVKVVNNSGFDIIYQVKCCALFYSLNVPRSLLNFELKLVNNAVNTKSVQVKINCL